MNGRAWILLLLAVVTTSAKGQQIPAPGTRVRVLEAGRDAPIATGLLERISGDTVAFVGIAAPVPVGTGRRLQVSAGMHRHTMRGVGRGLLIGAGVGALLGLAGYQKPDCSQGFICLDFGPAASAVAGAVLLGVPGMVIGGIVGSSRREEWHPVAPLRQRPAVAASISATQIGLSIAF